MLQGRAAGLTVITSGEPGAPANIRIHGIGNFGDVRPLYIIDGVQGDINSINPDDIESLQVLKDASAYSIYGVRGANGVIIVTTQKGKSGRTRISYDMYLGWQQPLEGLDLLSPQEWAELTWKAYRNSGQVVNGNPNHPLYGNGTDPVLPDYLFAGPHQDTLYEGNPYVNPALYNLNPDNGDIYQIVRYETNGTDWFHEMYKPAFSQNHTVTISGGNENNNFLASLGYLDQEGTLLNTSLKRFTARINSEFNLEKGFHFGENLQLSYSDNKRPEKFIPGSVSSNNNDANSAIFTAAYLPVYDIFGAWNPGSNDPSKGPDDNPVARRTLAKDYTTNQWQVLGNVYASMDFLKYFSAKSSFGGSLINYFNDQFIPASYDNVTNPNKYSESSGYVSSYTWTNTIHFAKTLGEHNLKALAGTEFINNYNRESGGTAFNLPFTDPDYWSLSNGDPNTKTNYSNESVSALSSLMGRIDYRYKNRYYLTGTIRRDGASYFGPENRFGWFPSIGLAWRLTEEIFLQKATWINELKIRGSWGKTGFYGNTDPYNQYTLYGGNVRDAYYDINGNSTGSIARGFRTLRIGNSKTGWQEDIVTNLGADAIFWKGKLSVSADWYIKKTEGLLFPLQLPALLGDALPPNVNVGSIENRGLDLTVGSRGSLSKEIGWDFLLTFSHYDNKIIRLTDIPYFDDFDSKIRNEVGYPVGSFFGYKIIGLFIDDADVGKSPVQPDAAPGRFKYADTNGRDVNGKITGKPDGFIDDADRLHLGSPHPDFTLGVNIGFHYKNLDFSTFFYGSFGNTVANDIKGVTDIAPYLYGVGSKDALYNSWGPDNKNTTIPIPELSFNFSNGGSGWNSYPLEDGSYLRNKSIMLGYTLPEKQLQHLHLDRLRIYIQVVNLFTITSYSGLDPELYKSPISPSSSFATNSVFGIDFGNYPNNQRQFLIGLNLGL
jgi:TonB-linked SusC/RagA family outer membrane protein